VLGVVVLGCVVYIYYQFAAPTPTTQPSAPVVTTSAPATGSGLPAGAGKAGGVPVLLTAAQMDPTLHMEAMKVTESLEYAGSGRNIFSPNSAPPSRPIPAPMKPVRTAAAGPPVPMGPPPKPAMPPIDLKLFGTSMRDGARKAFLLHGEDVYHAGDGEIVGRRYKVIKVGTTTVVVEDLPNNNQQTLPLETP
jgi:hypothetical protein